MNFKPMPRLPYGDLEIGIYPQNKFIKFRLPRTRTTIKIGFAEKPYVLKSNRLNFVEGCWYQWWDRIL